ncbi:uncharacterized protein PG998_000060 [Apiospora kogelbergensis]|uniref:uncharacterized protein n=1 Tax=Apiospora kogelbergensis TaxID=1337665 RepID=UPI0031322FB1
MASTPSGNPPPPRRCETSCKHRTPPLDPSDLASVRAFAADFHEGVAAGRIPPVRVLILNAGWQEFTRQTWTADGFDMTFGKIVCQDSRASPISLGVFPWSPSPPAICQKGAGRNSLGLDDRKAPLVVVLLTASFKTLTDQQTVEAAARNLMSAIEEEARRQGAYDPWAYLDYAAPWQDPIASYGERSLKRLREIQMKVDPQLVFTHRVPGGSRSMTIPATRYSR